jgi:tetratricopeptide (TPR) repeat protein
MDQQGDTVSTTPDGPATAMSSGSAILPADGRYHLLDEIARGGMGVVYRATDTGLGREVAVKVLADRFGPDSAAARRFADEARIAAQLQHPAIPPVHDLGTLPDGRPFLAMKLIKGRTLDDLLKDRPDPAADRGRFVAVFEKVCEAIAYAHAHNVIHRDLKPANVMVGSFGEVQVMDWGLAKVLSARSAEPGDPDATRGGTEVVSLRDSDGSFTQAGSVLGTPAFMPPEQAVGAVGKVDERSDVFGLGALLAVILTGQPPFAAHSAETTRVLAATGDVADCFARLEACRAGPELVALAKRCLSPRPDDRPADAGEVARAVADLRAAADERARRAELEQARSEVRATEQNRRRRALALAGGTLLGVLAVGIVASSLLAWGVYQEKLKVEQAERAAVGEKLKAEEAERVALAQSQLAIDALGEMVLDVQNELEDVPGAFLVRREILDRAYKLLERLNDTPATSDRVLRRHILAHMQVGDIAWALGERDKAHQEYRTAYDLARRAFEQNPASDKAKGNWAAMSTKLGESEQFHHKDFAEARRHYQIAARVWSELTEKMRAFPAGDPGLDPEERLDLPETERALADAYDHVGKIEYAEPDARKRDPAKALELLDKSLEMRERLFAADPSRENRYRLAVSHLYLADLALLNNDIEATLAHNAELAKHRAESLKARPTSLKAKRDLGDADLRLGDTAWYAGQKERALAAYQDGLKWYLQVMWSEPDSPYYRGRICQSHYCVGCGLLWKGDKAAALVHFREALKLREELYREAVARKTLGVAERSTLMLTLARCGEQARAVQLAEEVRPLADARVLAEEVGTTYGLCMAVIEDGRPLDQLTPDERALRDRYHDLAIAAIQEAVAKGYRTFLFLEGDPDMDPLLALPEFRHWLADSKKSLITK